MLGSVLENTETNEGESNENKYYLSCNLFNTKGTSEHHG